VLSPSTYWKMRHLCLWACVLLLSATVGPALAAEAERLDVSDSPIMDVATPVVRGLPESIPAATMTPEVPAADLQSYPIDGSMGGPNMGDPIAAQMDRKSPYVLDAVPLDGAGQDASATSGGGADGSGSGGSGGSAGSAGYGSSIAAVPLTPRRRCPGSGPCGGGGPPVPAKIVKQLSGSKAYGRVGNGIWSFNEKNAKKPKRNHELDLAKAEENFELSAQDDPVVHKLKQEFNKVKQSIQHEALWIEDVKHVVHHYKQKVAAVRLAMRKEHHHLQEIKAMIHARQKLDAKRALEAKLHRVHAQLKALMDATKNVSGEASNLTRLKHHLSSTIAQLNHKIHYLQSQDKGGHHRHHHFG